MENDFQKISSQIEQFIKNSVERFNKRGVIIGLSGGIDSTVVAYLSSKALGSDKVFGLIMPEKESSSLNIKDAREVANILKIKYKEIDLTPLLEEIGIYKLVSLKLLRNRIFLKRALKLFKKKRNINIIHSLGILGLTTPDRISQLATAMMLPKLRLRSIFLYYFGALKNLLVVGTTNKTEYLLGHYDKYGDGACDVEPIIDLYKTEVKKLAEFLEVPEKIIKKPATHDLFAGDILTDEVLIGLDFEKVDPILMKLEEGKKEEEIAKELQINLKIIREIKKAQENERLKRELPLKFRFSQSR
jgi:NAD+ synthase